MENGLHLALSKAISQMNPTKRQVYSNSREDSVTVNREYLLDDFEAVRNNVYWAKMFLMLMQWFKSESCIISHHCAK